MTDHDLPTRTEGEGETLDMPEGLGTFAPGQVLGERYQILEILGRGGMGEVWHAFDLKLRVEVALKALRADLFKSERRLELLRQEVRAAREVMSPNVCRIFDLIEVEDRELVSMEYVDGATLLGVLQERGPLELKEAQDIASQFLAGLEAIHKVGLIHRDIKPENIMLTRAGRVVVMDFGLARQDSEGGGSVSGTPAYMAPEQAAGQTLDARADVYAAGVVLAEMVSPDGIKNIQSRQSVWEGVRSEPAMIRDTPWAKVIEKAVARDREHRFNTAHTLTRALEDVTLRVEGADDLHPYPGLASFTENDAEFFFGREAEIEQMWRKFDRPHLMAVVGPSGAGKSSFLRAGLIPSAGPDWGVLRCTPGNNPFAGLGQALAREMAGDVEAVELLALGHEPNALLGVVSKWKQRHSHALLIVDQFEELFTHSPVDEHRRFTGLMMRIALEGDVFVLLSMRDDFLLRCREHDALAAIFTDLTALLPPTGAALRRAMVQPATKCGYRFENDALVEEMLAEVEGERGALPMLAFALARLWEMRDRETGLLTRQAYNDIGGVGGALARHAEATIDRIGIERLPTVRELFRNLVTAEGTRAVREWNELLSIFSDSQGESPEDVLRQLVDARLLTSYEVREDEHEPTRRVEIIHESLLANWPRLVRWQTQDQEGAQIRDELRMAARSWDEHGRPDDRLWTGTAYREFQLWRERYPGGLSETEEAFAAAMTSLATRRRRRRRIAVTAAFAVLLAVLAVVGSFWQRSVREMRRAEAQKLLALGQLEFDAEPASALAFARASLEVADTYEGRLFALRVLQKGPVARFIEPSVGVGLALGVTFSPDGEWCIVQSRGASFSVYHQSGGDPVFTGSDGRPFFFADGRGMGVHADDEIRVYSIPGFTEAARQKLVIDPEEFRRIVPTDRGLMILIDSYSGWEIVLWPVASPPEILTVIGHIVDLDINPAGEWIAYILGDDEHHVYLKSLLDPRAPPRRVHASDKRLSQVKLHPELEWIAVRTEESHDITVWPLDEDATVPLRSIDGHNLRFFNDPQGTRIIEFGKRDGNPIAFIHDLGSPVGAEPPVIRSRSRGEVLSARRRGLHPSGRWLAAANIGAAILWPLPEDPPLVLPGTGHLTNDLAFTMDGKSLVIPSAGGVRVQPIEGGGTAHHLLDDGWYANVAMDPRGQFAVLSRVHDPTAAVICPLEGSEPTRLELDRPMSANLLAYDPARELVAVGSFESAAEDKVIGVWDLHDGSMHVLGPTEDAGDAYEGSINGLEFLPDGNLLSASRGGGVRRWNLEDGSSEVLLAGRIWTFRVTPDGRTAVVAFGDSLGDIRHVILDLATNEVRPLEGFQGRCRGLEFSPRGDVLAYSTDSGEIQIGRLSGGVFHYFFGHETLVVGLAFSPDGSRLAAVDDHGIALRVWRMPDMTKPPFLALPYEELMAKLDSFTNLRVVRDENSPTGWKQEIGPFQGWETVPEW